MSVDGKGDDARKAQDQESQGPKLSENAKEDEVVLKGDAKVGEGNGEIKKVEEKKGNQNVSEKENVEDLLENEKGKCLSSPLDGSKEENGKEIDEGECFSSPSDAKGGESSSVREVNGFFSDLKEYEKKALMDLRSKLEEAVLTDKLFKKVKKEESQIENLIEEKEEESNKNVEEEEEKQEKPMEEGGGKTMDMGKAKMKEEYQERCDDGKKTKIVVEVDKDIALWGVPLLPSKEDKRTDVLLLKFLRARDFKAIDAFEMLKSTLEWRRENKIDLIMEEDFGNEYDCVGYMKGLDREGHLVCYNVYGVFANEEMYDKTFGTKGGLEKFLRWRLQLLEKEIQKLDFKPGGISTLLQINDLKDTPGPSRRDLRLATKRAVEILQDNYPEFVARNIFINVPFWYYAFNTLLSPFLTQRTKSKFVFSRPAKVTDTLVKYIAVEEIPIAYGGLRREDDPDFSTQDAASEVIVKAGAIETIEIPAPEVGNSLMWEVTIVGWDVNYKEEFVPTDEKSYTVIVKKGRKISWEQEPIRNSFKNKEAGKVVITIENGIFKKKRALYRYKTITNNDFTTSSSST